MKGNWTDKDWVCLFFNTNDIDETRKCMEGFRTAVLKEAAERAVKCLNTFERDWVSIGGKVYAQHEKELRAAILGDQKGETE